MNPLGKVPVDISLGVFMFGLEESVSSELRLMDPTNLKIAMEWAEKIEQKDWTKSYYGRTRKQNQWGPTYSTQISKPYPQTHDPPYFPKPLSSAKPNSPPPKHNPDTRIKQLPLTDKEMREKRSRGVCFKCDERWSCNHVCRNKEFRLILL